MLRHIYILRRTTSWPNFGQNRILLYSTYTCQPSDLAMLVCCLARLLSWATAVAKLRGQLRGLLSRSARGYLACQLAACLGLLSKCVPAYLASVLGLRLAYLASVPAALSKRAKWGKKGRTIKHIGSTCTWQRCGSTQGCELRGRR